jgi:alkanesulfonate monooxygenase SsuD/methylene tetrahydromethanopterin reductase-like flavin-dependent oxidoreductase (luciferase family)
MTIEVGFGLVTCQRYPGDSRSDAELYAEALDLAVLAEDLGFDSVWVSEHHFVDDAYMPSLLPVCAAIAARTSTIRIGTALLLAPLYDPLRLAEDAATVDLISGGRLTLGLGLGWREEEFEVFRIPISERGARLRDSVAILRESWSGALVTGRDTLSYPGVRVLPDPVTPGGPPIWIGALRESAVHRAGAIGDGFMSSSPTPESFAREVAWAREGLEKAGRGEDDFAFSLHVPTVAWEGPADDAWSIVEPHVRYVSWKYDDMDQARGRTAPPREPPPPTAEESRRLRDETIAGTPEEVADRIHSFAKIAGGDLHYIARMYWPGMGPERQRETMRLFAETVVPVLRGSGM